MAGDVKRAVRVANRLRQELAELLVRYVRDPRLEGLVITRVQLTDDLHIARVYVILDRAGAAERRHAALAGLESAAGLLRREVTQRAGLRHAPELRFIYDEANERVSRIDELLEEIRRDDKPE